MMQMTIQVPSFVVYLRAEITKWAKLIKDSGMRAE